METLKNNVIDLVNNSQYNDAVNLVAESFNLSFKAEFLRNDFHFVGDKDKRDIYKITLSRGNRKYSFEFGQSIAKSGFYASYGRQKYTIPREKINTIDSDLKVWVKFNKWRYKLFIFRHIKKKNEHCTKKQNCIKRDKTKIECCTNRKNTFSFH